MAEQAPTPSEVLGRQVKRWRTKRGLSAQALADRAAEIGAAALTRVAISKIEVGQRGVSVDEWIQLAYALAVPPPLLLVDLQSGERVQLAPAAVVHPWLAWEFITGEEPPVMSDHSVMRPAEYSAAMTVVRLYRRQSEAANGVYAAESAISAAQYAKDADALSLALTRHADALRALGRCLADMQDEGVEPPAMVPEWVKAMKRLKVLPDKVLMYDGTDRG